MGSMLRKKETFTIITPIPGFIPRQLAIDILHSHSEVITLNPLVLDHKAIKAPRDAASDEYYSTWYEISQRIQYIPGLGKMGSGKISFKGCFHDMPWGLQTHIYAPMNVDLRNRYRICGNQPGIEPPEQPEIGLSSLGAPSDGLYLRDDVEIKCNFSVVSFVKAQLKAASKDMVSRIIKKAELLDAGILHAMIEDGKLKTINPQDRTNTPSGMGSPRPSPTTLHPNIPGSPPIGSVPYQIPRPASYQYFKPDTPTQNLHWSTPYGRPPSSQAEVPAPVAGMAQQVAAAAASMPVEMPGDYYHPQSSPHLQPPQPSPIFKSDRASSTSGHSSQPSHQSQGDWRWSQSQSQGGASRPSSVSSDMSAGGFQSPGLSHEGFASELPTHRETMEEHHGNNSSANVDALKKLDPASQGSGRGSLPSQKSYAYNPADYAKVGSHASHAGVQQQQKYGYSY